MCKLRFIDRKSYLHYEIKISSVKNLKKTWIRQYTYLSFLWCTPGATIEKDIYASTFKASTCVSNFPGEFVVIYHHKNEWKYNPLFFTTVYLYVNVFKTYARCYRKSLFPWCVTCSNTPLKASLRYIKMHEKQILILVKFIRKILLVILSTCYNLFITNMLICHK